MPSAPCGAILDSSPFLCTAQVPEGEISIRHIYRNQLENLTDLVRNLPYTDT